MSPRRTPRHLNVPLSTIHPKRRRCNMVRRYRRTLNLNKRVSIPQHVSRNSHRVTKSSSNKLNRCHSTSHPLRHINIRRHVTIVSTTRPTGLPQAMRRHFKRHNLTHIRVDRGTHSSILFRDIRPVNNRSIATKDLRPLSNLQVANQGDHCPRLNI